ncbi:MAG: hotdog fold thioesterase [Rhodospirillaceae bacterium]|nr:hotdog fold thioesterase [Rhodospirillaceae bacterium]MBT6119272.1 hotdog fold thioesterase [Rhodospirillaceae bacterium]
MLGIEFTDARPDRVVARMALAPAHYTRGDVVHGGVIMAMADCCGAYGTVLNLPPGHTTGTIESKTNFMRRGEGAELMAESTPVHLGRTLCVWRTAVRRGAGRPIAEITQTQIVMAEASEDSGTAANAARGKTDAEAGAESVVVADRKRQIFEGASRVLSEKGYAAATIREIAAAAGMPVPTMYQYIERKEDLLFFIYESFMADYTAALRATVAAAATPDAKLDAALKETIANFDRNHEYIKLMFQETRALAPEARRRVYELDGRYIAVWREILAGIVPVNGAAPADPALMANFIYFLCTVWPLRHWAIADHGRAAVEAALSAFVKGGLGLTLENPQETNHG